MDASSTSEATTSTHGNLPALALSDIMHHLSPSPVDPSSNTIARPNSPLPVSSADVMTMRGRLRELQSAAQNGPDTTGVREAELLQMVSRLTETLPIDPAQLERQAETIGQLVRQRDLLVKEAEQERVRMQAERESWERTAEALISQRTRLSKSEELDRTRGLWEAENRSVREKLRDTERKLAIMEAEVTRLRPLLLMQPYTAAGLKQLLTTSKRDKGKKREVEQGTRSGIPETGRDVHNSKDPSTSSSRPTTRSQTKAISFPISYTYPPGSVFPPPPKITVTSPDSLILVPNLNKSQSSRRSYVFKQAEKAQRDPMSAPLTADALTAHLLLAADKIGRHRSTIVSGIQNRAEKERQERAKARKQRRLHIQQVEKEKSERLQNTLGHYRPGTDPNSPEAEEDPENIPKTPKKSNYHPQAIPGQFVFINASAESPPQGINRIAETRTPVQNATTSNPPTPMDSLLDAARTMMDDSGRRKAPEHPESPVPKRRRVSGAAASKGNGKLTRVRSALEVLAEEAAAASGSASNAADGMVEDTTDNRAGLLDSHLSSKGKGKAKATSKPTENISSTAPSSSIPTSTSRTTRQSSRRRTSLHNPDETATGQPAQQSPKTGSRGWNKESVPATRGRPARKSISQTHQHENRAFGPSRLLAGPFAGSSLARVITPSESYFASVPNEGIGRLRPAYPAPAQRQPSISDSESDESSQGHGDVNFTGRRDGREGDAGLAETLDSRVYSTAETTVNQSFEQGRDTTAGVSASTIRPDRDSLAPETSNRSLSTGSTGSVDALGRGVGMGTGGVGVDDDLDESDDDEDSYVPSDMDMLADDDDDDDDDDDEYERTRTTKPVVGMPSAPRTVRSYAPPQTIRPMGMPPPRTRSHSPPPPQVHARTTQNDSGRSGTGHDQDSDTEGEIALGDGEGQHPAPAASS